MSRKPTQADGQAALASAQKEFSINEPKIGSLYLEVVGTADLIQNAFSQKALEQMLKKHMGIPFERENKKPRELLEAATVRNTDDRICIPSTAFKKAMLTASTQLKGLKKTQLRTSFFIVGNSVPITFETMEPRMDMVRTAGIVRQPDIRFRPSFQNWKARLEIQYSDNLNPLLVGDLLQRAGKVGVGEWRPEKDGNYGTFRVDRAIVTREERDEVSVQCAYPLKSLKIPDWAMDAEIDPELLRRIFDAQATGKPPADLDEVG